MIEAMMSVFVFLVLPIAFLVSLGKGHDETIEGVPPYPKPSCGFESRHSYRTN